MNETVLTLIISNAVALIVGVFGKDAWNYFGSKRKTEVETDAAEIDGYAKVRKLIEELIEDGRKKDAALSAKTEEASRLTLTNNVLTATIESNNKFMKEVLIGWGEMKKSEEMCQKRLVEVEHRLTQLESQTA